MRYLIFILSILALASCSKKELMTYEEGSGIFFDTKDMVLDTVGVAWGLKNSDVLSQKVRFEVKLIGQVTDYDRKFKIKVKHDVTDTLEAKENVDYKAFPLEYAIPKGKASAFIEVELLRTPILATENRILTIQLEESVELGFLYTRQQVDTLGVARKLDVQRVLKMNENFPQPRWWGIFGNNIFGNWSLKKQILICEIMEIDREKWIGDVVTDPKFSEGFLRFCGVKMHRWLQDRKAQGNPYFEADNVTPMEMGSGSKR